MICPLTVWGLYYEKTADDVCTDAHIWFDIISDTISEHRN